MSWEKVSALTDIFIACVLVTWITLDRCNIYFRKDKE